MTKLCWALLFAVLSIALVSCGDDDPTPPNPTPTDPDPVASFQFAVDGSNYLQVAFSNFSQNATSYSWNFGDGNTSTEESPTHTYAMAGDYTVTLTASNAAGASAMRSESLTITDPNAQLTLLAGQSSKTWYLQREGVALGIGPGVNDNQYWSFGDVTPLADRPCILDDAYTFHRDGTFGFSSNGTLFVDAIGNGGWERNGNDGESCEDESTAGVWGDNNDRQAFGDGGDYTFVLDNTNNTLTINGLGAYIGLSVKTEAGDNNLPVQSKTYSIFNLTEGSIADTLQMSIVINDGNAWNFYLVSYENEADLPPIPTEAPVFGEDLPDDSPTSLVNNFAGDGTNNIDTIRSGSGIIYGVDDPADAAAAKVGEFIRTDAQYQELQLQTSPTAYDINFSNLSTISIDVYLPSTNDYSGSLTKNVIIGLADASQTQQWWTDQTEYIADGSAIADDTWTTLTFNLDEPDYVAKTETAANPFGRNDYDMIYLNIGGSDHTNTGTFYVRNLRFE